MLGLRVPLLFSPNPSVLHRARRCYIHPHLHAVGMACALNKPATCPHFLTHPGDSTVSTSSSTTSSGAIQQRMAMLCAACASTSGGHLPRLPHLPHLSHTPHRVLAAQPLRASRRQPLLPPGSLGSTRVMLTGILHTSVKSRVNSSVEARLEAVTVLSSKSAAGWIIKAVAGSGGYAHGRTVGCCTRRGSCGGPLMSACTAQGCGALGAPCRGLSVAAHALPGSGMRGRYCSRGATNNQPTATAHRRLHMAAHAPPPTLGWGSLRSSGGMAVAGARQRLDVVAHALPPSKGWCSFRSSSGGRGISGARQRKSVVTDALPSSEGWGNDGGWGRGIGAAADAPEIPPALQKSGPLHAFSVSLGSRGGGSGKWPQSGGQRPIDSVFSRRWASVCRQCEGQEWEVVAGLAGKGHWSGDRCSRNSASFSRTRAFACFQCDLASLPTFFLVALYRKLYKPKTQGEVE